jgi:hypothetical protein
MSDEQKAFNYIPPDSILYRVVGVKKEFGKKDRWQRKIARQFEKILLPIVLLLVIAAFTMQGQARQPIPGLGLSPAAILSLAFFGITAIVVVFLLGSQFFLKTKAGGAQGALKMNIISKFTGSRINDMEIDVLIKSSIVMNRDTARLMIFNKIIDDKGRLKIQTTEEDTFMTSHKTLPELVNNPAIKRLMNDINIEFDEKKEEIVVRDAKGKKVDNKKVKETFLQKTQGNQSTALVLKEQENQRPTFSPRASITERVTVERFLQGKDELYIHVVDVSPEYEYRGMKLPGLIFLHEKKNISEIFPQPVNVYAVVGWTFGIIPMHCIDFVPIDDINGIPIFIPTTSKERNLKLANLGYWQEKFPSIEAVVAAKNLIQLEVALPFKKLMDFYEQQNRAVDQNINKMTRKGIGFSNRIINYWKIIHKPEEKPILWLYYAILGFFLAVFTSPLWYPIFTNIARWFTR